MNFLSLAFRRVAFLVWHWQVRSELRAPNACRLFGLDLVIAPGVLHPRHFASSRLLAEHLLSLPLRGLRVADLGTGSGLLALLAARAGATVTATDISPTAVACARANAARNGVGAPLRIMEGDVFGDVSASTAFDLIVTNPPFYPRRPESFPDQAFASGEGHRFFETLAAALPGRLSPKGTLLLVHSSDTDFAPISARLETKGLSGRVVSEHRGFFETLTIREFRHR